jgi:hypothetical protein
VHERPLRVWIGGTLALERASVPPAWQEWLAALTRLLTLRRRNVMSGESAEVPFFLADDAWLYIPRGLALTGPGADVLSRSVVQRVPLGDQRLPAGAHMDGVTWGAPPFPSGQAQFIADIVAGAQKNRHGGLCIAPTRSGKTFCSVEAACRLGLRTLILVDRGLLLEQWRGAIEGHPAAPGPRVRDETSQTLRCGVIREDKCDLEHPFSVAMVQTLARRALPEAARKAFGTIIVDECQGAPADSIFGTLMRFDAQYVLGLTATPDRADGLGRAIPWLIGPQIAKLERQVDARVIYLRHPYSKQSRVMKAGPDGAKPGRLHITRYGQPNNVNAEKMLAADPTRVALIVHEAMKDRAQGHRVLIPVGQRDHLALLRAAFRQAGYDPGVLQAGESSTAAMRRDIVLMIDELVKKGVDFQPPATVLILALPRSDVRQLTGRVLQPQAPCVPTVKDIVDGAKSLIKQAYSRTRFYRDMGFRCGSCEQPLTAGCACSAVWPADLAVA